MEGFSGTTIRQIFNFIDAIIRLPSDFELQFKDDIFKFEETKHMAYINSVERICIEEARQNGMQQGMQQGIREIALRMLRKGQSIEMISEITGLSKKELLILSQQQNERVNS